MHLNSRFQGGRCPGTSRGCPGPARAPSRASRQRLDAESPRHSRTGQRRGRGLGAAGDRWKSSQRQAGKGRYLPTSRTGKLGEEKEGGQRTPFPAAPPGAAGIAALPPRVGGGQCPPSLPPAAPGPALPLLRPLAPPPPPGGGEGGAAPTAAAVRGAGCRGLCAAASTTQPGMGTAMGSSRRSSCRGQTPLRMSAAGGLL